MLVKVRIPTPLRKMTGGKSGIEVEANNIRQMIDNMESQFPGIKENLCDNEGNLKRFINIYLGDDNIVDLDKMNTQLKEGIEVSLVPAIAGGVFQ